MRSLRKAVGVRAEDDDRTYGEGGIMGADMVFWASRLHEQLLPALEGWLVGVDLPEDLSEKLMLWLVDGVDAMEMAGDKALRNSV